MAEGTNKKWKKDRVEVRFRGWPWLQTARMPVAAMRSRYIAQMNLSPDKGIKLEVRELKREEVAEAA